MCVSICVRACGCLRPRVLRRVTLVVTTVRKNEMRIRRAVHNLNYICEKKQTYSQQEEPRASTHRASPRRTVTAAARSLFIFWRDNGTRLDNSPSG
ncbi:hypothetical protein EVAR_13188_1 [Eumeta japonica]|uniref:Uncharacterized protein n=1 Tax=Eumeta variegata TaxID=151549 RepID=A0A4C1TS20_EUMVA|nr:hypothetical protein EVAR_13188_1 [Eumeta japonica]